MEPMRNRRFCFEREEEEEVVSVGADLFGVSSVGEGLKQHEGLKELMWWW